jgi:hypothetical protein
MPSNFTIAAESIEPTAASDVIRVNGSQSVDDQEKYAAFVRRAEALPASEVQPCRADVCQAVANVMTGASSIDQPETIARIKKALPEIDVPALLALPILGQALVQAAEETAPVAKDVELAAALDRGAVLMRTMRPQLELLVRVGILSPMQVEATRNGRTAMDLSRNLTASAQLLSRCSPDVSLMVSAEMIEEARSLGMTIRSHIASRAVAEGLLKARKDAAEPRDRLWTLLVHDHKELRRVARYLWDAEADCFVPPLRSMKRVVRKSPASAAKSDGATDAPSAGATSGLEPRDE